MFFLHGEKSYVFVGLSKYCVAHFTTFFCITKRALPRAITLSLSLSVYTSLLALFECVRPCRWLVKVKVSPIFHAICLGLAMCSLSGLFALACSHSAANYITQTEEKWKREWKKRKRKRKVKKKKRSEFEFKVSHRPHALRSSLSLSHLLWLSLAVEPKSRLHAWVKTIVGSLCSWLSLEPGEA